MNRALHHYDEVGLLRPSSRSASGYRRYDDGDLDRLQRILAYRELGGGFGRYVGRPGVGTPDVVVRQGGLGAAASR